MNVPYFRLAAAVDSSKMTLPPVRLLFSLLPPVLQLLQALPVSLRSQPVLQLLWLL